MSDAVTVSSHYSHGDLLSAIKSALAEMGKSINGLTDEDLAPVDEFHIGGRKATEHLLGSLNFSQQSHVLDVGCGLGGASRYVARSRPASVTGIDLTLEYVETGNALCRWVDLDKQITLRHQSALSMSFENETFDGAYMMHVGMNIDDKEKLFREIFRVLRPGALFGVYDVMRINDGDLTFPVPWATNQDTSALAGPERYRQAIGDAGFQLIAEHNRRDFALAFFREVQANNKASGGPPALGLHTLMKETRGEKVRNMVQAVVAELISPIEMIARKN